MTNQLIPTDTNLLAPDDIAIHLEATLDDYCRGKSPNTQRAVRYAMQSFMDYVQASGSHKATAGLLNSWYGHLRETPTERCPDGNSHITAKTRMSLVKSVLDTFNLNNPHLMIPHLFMVKAPTKAKDDKLHFRLTAEQTQSLLNAPDANTAIGSRDRAVLALLLGAGLRRFEIANLKWGHVAIRDGHPHLIDMTGKGGRVRSFAFPPWVHRALQDWKSWDIGDGEHVFCTMRKAGKYRGPMNGQAAWRVVERHCLELGITKLQNAKVTLPRPHDLRRTFARHYYIGGGDIKQLQQILGHSSVATTEKYIGTLENPDAQQPAQFLPYKIN